MIVYISIGNSDDRLTQAEWSQFCQRLGNEVRAAAPVIHGIWLSAPDARYQNACWCAEFDTGLDAMALHDLLPEIAAKYRQDSIAWAVVRGTEFIKPA